MVNIAYTIRNMAYESYAYRMVHTNIVGHTPPIFTSVCVRERERVCVWVYVHVWLCVCVMSCTTCKWNDPEVLRIRLKKDQETWLLPECCY